MQSNRSCFLCLKAREVRVTAPQGFSPVEGTVSITRRAQCLQNSRSGMKTRMSHLSGSELQHQSTESISWALLLHRVFWFSALKMSAQVRGLGTFGSG